MLTIEETKDFANILKSELSDEELIMIILQIGKKSIENYDNDKK